jgi:hypothetical protein
MLRQPIRSRWPCLRAHMASNIRVPAKANIKLETQTYTKYGASALEPFHRSTPTISQSTPISNPD